MSVAESIHYLLGGGLILVSFWFAVGSVLERRMRAMALAVVLMDLTALVWFGPAYMELEQPMWHISLDLGLVLFLIMFFAPIGRTEKILSEITGSRVDERDSMFAREEYRPGTARYDEYYDRRPELKKADDGVRQLPQLLAPGGRYYDKNGSEHVKNIFAQIKRMTTAVDGEVSPSRPLNSAEQNSKDIRQFLKKHGASDVGTALLNPMYVYSHVGRGPEPYGSEITNKHRYVIVFAVEMSYNEVEAAPQLPTMIETAHKYLVAAEASVELAKHIRSLGYPARAHISDSNYQIMLPPAAVDAGLGELGRMGYLVSPKLGGRIRLGAVTTDLPLAIDKPISFGVQDFCARCNKCATNCPSGAIPLGEKQSIRGVGKWPLDVVRCIRYWRIVGTDCGLCMRVCPFSHPPTLIHNLVRVGIRRSAFARQVSVWMDDLFYGRTYGLKGPDRSSDQS